MNQAELDTFRQQLLELRIRLRGDVSHLTTEALRKTGGEASGSLSNTPIHMADLGTDNFEQEFTLGLIQNEEQALDEIAGALDRLDQHTFGRCEECQKEIPRPRFRRCPTPVTASNVPGSSNKAREEPMTERSYRKLFWGLAAVGFVADQVSKYSVFRWLYNGEDGPRGSSLIPGVFDFSIAYTREKGSGLLSTWSGELLPHVNRGALFGIGDDQYPGVANVLFAVISLAAAIAIAWWAARPSVRHERGLSAALGLILAGTLGNLYDRLVFGGVRDFMDVYFQSSHWPTFNVADCCLVCGAFLLLAQAFFGKAPAESPAKARQEMAQVR